MIPAISHYRLEGELGRGGMGIVYRAVDTRLGRAVAIKMLPAEATADAERNRRFVQEARAASALNHPHIVTIHDIDEDAGSTFIAMELVDGTPLDRLIAGGALPIAQTLEYATQVASALEAAHASGIIHRDIKPANIMITRDGRAKVLDFGLAKLIDRSPAQSTMTALGTRPGIIMGTAAYMSPEQAEGRPVDARSDIFSFGAVLYEMLAGRRPFVGTSDLGVITAILRDQPPPMRSARADVPAQAQSIVDRCLAKDPAARYADAGALGNDLAAVRAGIIRPPDVMWRRPAVLIPAAVVLLLAGSFGVWQTIQARRLNWVQQEAIPAIERLERTDQSLDAVRLARQAAAYAPAEIERVRQGWIRFQLVTQPEGAEVEIKNYMDVNGAWESLGRTPLQPQPLPFGYYRLRISKPGFLPIEISSPTQGRPLIRLTPAESAQPGMVLVAGGRYSIGVADGVHLPDFWIDKLEVTNKQFKEFVDAGGYRNAKYWKEPFRARERALTFDEAIARFRDATGRTGPATWELGSYLEGHGDYPVGGISWFEATAYAEFAGKTLPSFYHWARTAGVDELSSDILRLSNFDHKGPVKVGERQGLAPWGTLDMAGNVKEWCVNQVRDQDLRYILGGGWNEPSYRFSESDARDPWDRQPTFGVRLVKNLGPADQASAPRPSIFGDPKSVVPVSDEVLQAYLSFYAYDRTPLNARVESTDDSSPHWRKETISFDAAYGGERIPAYLFLPRNTSPRYQTVLYFPSAYAVHAPSSTILDVNSFEFIVRSGRALLYPVYQGTFERRRSKVDGPSGMRDMHVQWAKDFFRAVDYLETREDIDIDRLGYYSRSMGAYFGPIPVSQEPRIKAAVFASGGLRYNYPPEVQPANFMPRVKAPVLLINGRDDFATSLEAQRRLIELLGTPAEHKYHVPLEGGHVPNDVRREIREVLDFFDKYLGVLK